MLSRMKHITIDGMTLNKIAKQAKSNDLSKQMAMIALENDDETISDLLTLTCYNYSKLAMERLFLNSKINELFINNSQLLKVSQAAEFD